MARRNGKRRCAICEKEKATLKCGGCSEDFCYDHWDPHRQQLDEELDQIQINRDLFRQLLNQHMEQIDKQPLIQQINQWKQKSIEIIQQTAEEATQIILKNSQEYHLALQIKLNQLTSEIRQSRDQNDFNEINLCLFREELQRLTEELLQPTTISLREDSTSFINRISVHVSSQ